MVPAYRKKTMLDGTAALGRSDPGKLERCGELNPRAAERRQCRERAFPRPGRQELVCNLIRRKQMEHLLP